MTPSVQVNGATVRMLVAKSEMRQKDVAKALGVGAETLSRWCRNGKHNMEEVNAKRLADFLKCDVGAITGSMPEPTRAHTPSPIEEDLIQAYRTLTPLQQARIRVAIEEMRLPDSQHGA
jgi:transcriptional regulator with XRE-family HTH domain